MMTKAPPQRALQFFRWYCRRDRLEELEGDLLEMHDFREREGLAAWKLKLAFWWDVIRCFKRYSIKNSNKAMNFSLYRSYLKLALRNAWKNKVPVAINVVGMGLSLGFCITVYMLFAYNLEFDTFYTHTDDVYRVQSLKTDINDEKRFELAPIAMLDPVQNNISGVSAAAGYLVGDAIAQYGTDYFEQWMAYASPNFLEFFDIPVKAGNPAAFKNVNTAFLSIESAEKMFGEVSPLGETLILHIGNKHRVEVQIAGVFEKIPLNSSFDFNIILNLPSYLAATGKSANDWGEDDNIGIYLRTMTPETVETALQEFIPIQNKGNETWQLREFDLVPFRDKRNADHIINYSHANMRVGPQPLIIFTVMGLLILLVACFNLANSSMALIGKRVKEIGIRKTLGTRNRQIFEQFLFEMLLVTSLSFLVSIWAADLIGREFWGMFGVSFFLYELNIANFLGFILAFLLICTFMAGVFPAYYAWRFQPVSILNNKHSLKGVGWAQKTLIVGQYAFSIAVLVAGFIFAQNTDFLKNMNYGFDHRDILVLPINDQDNLEALKNELGQQSYTQQMASTHDHFRFEQSRSILEIDTGKVEIPSYQVGENYLEMMQVEILDGRNILANSSFDESSSILVNQTFAEQFYPGESAVSKVIKVDDQRRTIAGVTNDVIQNVYADYLSTPAVLEVSSAKDPRFLVIKTDGQEHKTIEVSVKSLWSKHFDSPYEGQWQHNVTFGTATRDSNNLRRLFTSLAGLAGLLSVIGIFSLASMNVARKTKEISIRKILGASFQQILFRVNKPFVTLLFIAMVLGVGLGYFIGDSILQSIYKYYIDASIPESVGIGILMVVLALLFVGAAVIRPVRANPSEGLRTE